MWYSHSNNYRDKHLFRLGCHSSSLVVGGGISVASKHWIIFFLRPGPEVSYQHHIDTSTYSWTNSVHWVYTHLKYKNSYWRPHVSYLDHTVLCSVYYSITQWPCLSSWCFTVGDAGFEPGQTGSLSQLSHAPHLRWFKMWSRRYLNPRFSIKKLH